MPQPCPTIGVMAILHQAELRPSKLELLANWLPTQDWSGVGQLAVSDLHRVASYRFDDPAGEVGIETMIVRAGEGPCSRFRSPTVVLRSTAPSSG